jgi:anti-anti-sigma factor
MLRKPRQTRSGGEGVALMEFQVVELDADTNCIVLTGRLDAQGASTIEVPFTATMKGTDRHALVDISDVSFVASLGMRMLFSVARVVQRKGRRMVLFGAQPSVLEVFETVAMDKVIPLAADRDQALAMVQT